MTLQRRPARGPADRQPLRARPLNEWRVCARLALMLAACCSRAAAARCRAADLHQPARRRLPLQLGADERGHQLSHRRRSGDRPAQGRLLSLPDSGRRLLALDRPHDWTFITPSNWPNDGHRRARGDLGRRPADPVAVDEPAGTDLRHHRPGERQARLSRPAHAAAARHGRQAAGADEAGRSAARARGIRACSRTMTAAGTSIGTAPTSSRSTASRSRSRTAS